MCVCVCLCVCEHSHVLNLGLTQGAGGREGDDDISLRCEQKETGRALREKQTSFQEMTGGKQEVGI